MSQPKIIAEIAEAYKKTGLKPIANTWFKKGEACPLGVLARVTTGKRLQANAACKWSKEIYGHEYQMGFTYAVDTNFQACLTGRDKQFVKGYKHGKIARKKFLAG